MTLRVHSFLALSLFTLAACGDASAPSGSVPPADTDAGVGEDAQADDVQVGDAPADSATLPDAPGADAADAGDSDAALPSELQGFIGSPCMTTADCVYDGAVCLTDGFPNGMCSLPCDSVCPDQDGYPVTSCGNASEVPESGAIGDGLCVSRCDFGAYPDDGCRDGYGCVTISKANDPATLKFVCLPNRQNELGACYFDLAARGVAFEPTVLQDESPDGMPDVTCHVEDPLYLESPVHGVALRSSDGTETRRVLTSCKLAGSIVSTIDDVAPFGVVGFRHMGTYNCRVIAGTSTLSQHSFGKAIDIAGFDFDDGRLWTVYDDWEHETATPQTDAGKFLYEAAHRWFDALYWNIILTPNYNADHDDHFHVDLTSGSHFLGFRDGRYIGPAPYED